MVASSVAFGSDRDRTARIPLHTNRPGPAADLAILHQDLFPRLEIRRFDFDAAQLAAVRTFNLEDHPLILPDPTITGQESCHRRWTFFSPVCELWRERQYGVAEIGGIGQESSCYPSGVRPIEALSEDGLLRPVAPLNLRPGERVALMVLRRSDPSRWDLGRLASSPAEDGKLAGTGLDEWSSALDREDEG